MGTMPFCKQHNSRCHHSDVPGHPPAPWLHGTMLRPEEQCSPMRLKAPLGGDAQPHGGMPKLGGSVLALWGHVQVCEVHVATPGPMD